jgi:hypothetical protein
MPPNEHDPLSAYQSIQLPAADMPFDPSLLYYGHAPMPIARWSIDEQLILDFAHLAPLITVPAQENARSYKLRRPSWMTLRRMKGQGMGPSLQAEAEGLRDLFNRHEALQTRLYKDMPGYFEIVLTP